MGRGRLLVLGIGNPSRMDDGVGHHVVERLANWMADNQDGDSSGRHDLAFSQVDTDAVHQLAPELSYDVQDYDVVVFVDARVGEDTTPVSFRRIEPAYSHGAVTHFWSADSLLALTEHIFGTAPRGYMLSIAGHRFDFSTELSPGTRAAADAAVEQLIAFTRAGQEVVRD